MYVKSFLVNAKKKKKKSVCSRSRGHTYLGSYNFNIEVCILFTKKKVFSAF